MKLSLILCLTMAVLLTGCTSSSESSSSQPLAEGFYNFTLHDEGVDFNITSDGNGKVTFKWLARYGPSIWSIEAHDTTGPVFVRSNNGGFSAEITYDGVTTPLFMYATYGELTEMHRIN